MSIKNRFIAFSILFSTLIATADGFSGFKAPKQSFLSPAEAFKVTASKEGDIIKTRITLGDKIYIYAKKLHFKITKPTQSATELKFKKPKTQKHGEYDIYRSAEFDIPLADIQAIVKKDYTLTVELTGCSDAGICYQPQTFNFDFKYTGAKEGLIAKISRLTKEGNTAKIADVLVNESSFFILLLFFVFGLFLALTPCIFPMIPILSSIIVSQAGKDKKASAGRAFFTSLVYVVSMALAYTVVGVIAGLVGADIQAAMAKPWVIILFSMMFVALAFSLFGYFEIGLPAKWQSKLSSASDNAQGKGIVGTAIMGVLSALIVGPCVAPPLGGAILFISHTGDALLGGLALFVMSIGMGVPLLLVGLGAGKFMPKPGGWMMRISQIFGVMMLMMALYMLDRLLPSSVTMVLASLILIGSAVYMGVFDNSDKRQGVGKLINLSAFVLLLYGSMLFVGAMSGSSSLLHPLDRFVGQGSKSVKVSDKIDRSTRQGYSPQKLEAEIKEASKQGKPVVVDIGKEGCAACTELELRTFPDPAVKSEMKRFKFIQIDITKNTPQEQAILKKYQIFGAPNILFFDSKGKVQPDKFITGFREPALFVKDLQSVR